jgi:hypothetical protein
MQNLQASTGARPLVRCSDRARTRPCPLPAEKRTGGHLHCRSCCQAILITLFCAGSFRAVEVEERSGRLHSKSTRHLFFFRSDREHECSPQVGACRRPNRWKSRLPSPSPLARATNSQVRPYGRPVGSIWGTHFLNPRRTNPHRHPCSIAAPTVLRADIVSRRK